MQSSDMSGPERAAKAEGVPSEPGNLIKEILLGVTPSQQWKQQAQRESISYDQTEAYAQIIQSMENEYLDVD